MIYTKKIKNAIRFAVKTHEVYQKQKRKGKNIPYITHPFTVGLILACAGASEDVVVAGILHDTIEDSIPEKKVTKEMIEERFGENVAEIVLSVTEQDKKLSWEERKKEALERIKTFSHDSVLVKSADVISNWSEILDDYDDVGEDVWKRFKRPKEIMLENAYGVISALQRCWPESPFADDLQNIVRELQSIGTGKFMTKNYEIFCDNCGKIITEVAIYPNGENKEDLRPTLELSGVGWICSSTVHSFTKETLFRIAKLIEEKRFRELAQIDNGHIPFGFFCWNCKRNYCAGCWTNITPVFDENFEGFYDYAEANCPVGHKQIIND